MARIFTRLVLAAAAAAVSVMPALTAEVRYSDWSDPVNLGPIVNSVNDEFGVTISKDGLSLYFHSNSAEGFGGTDIWVSRRPSVDDPWESPENLGPTVNTEHNENTPKLSLDGHRLYFASNRPGGFGGGDIYVSRRRDKRDDLAWEPPHNLGSGVNGPANDGGPAPFEDDATGILALYFFSARPGGPGGADIYVSTLQADETFGPSVLVEELSSPSADIVPDLSRDGREIFITSNRPGSVPFPPPFTGRSFDLWTSTRASTNDPWSIPVNMGPVFNTAINDGWAALAFHGTALYFSTWRPGAVGEGNLDLYVSMRSKH